MKTSTPTKEQVAEWKEKHGGVYKLNAEGEKVAYIRDPLYDLQLMKLAYKAMESSDNEFIRCILNNCWLQGDEEIKTIEKYHTGLEDQIKKLVDIPDAIVTRVGSKFVITVEGHSCEVRMAVRADLIQAREKNVGKVPFETNINLLNIINLKGAEEIKKANMKAYLGVIVSLDQVKDRAFVGVEKL